MRFVNKTYLAVIDIVVTIGTTHALIYLIVKVYLIGKNDAMRTAIAVDRRPLPMGGSLVHVPHVAKWQAVRSTGVKHDMLRLADGVGA